MEREIREDLKITGVGNAAGGSYNKVKITGNGQVNGDVDCVSFSSAGNAKVNGGVKATSFTVRGSSRIDGNLEADRITIQGDVSLSGNAVVREAHISGTMTVKNKLVCDVLKLRGAVNIEGDCEVETLNTIGSFNIDGLLNVGRMDLNVRWPSQAKEIGGERIIVKKSNIALNLLQHVAALFKVIPGACLTVQSIEGDDIELEYTIAKVVRGNNVKIGRGCEIERVEYRNQFHQEQDAVVNNHIRV